jgi:hypothetical protein
MVMKKFGCCSDREEKRGRKIEIVIERERVTEEKVETEGYL